MLDPLIFQKTSQNIHLQVCLAGCVVSYSGFSFWIDIDWVGGVIFGGLCDIGCVV